MGAATPISVQDALWLTMDRPNNLMIIDGVLILAAIPGYDAVLEVVRTRVADRFPVYRRKPVRSRQGWTWLDDPDFDLTRHVRKVRLPVPADIPALQRFMSEQRGTSLPRSRPLWVVFVVERVLLEDGTTGSAIVCRFHHAMADGVRLTQVMLSMCDTDEPAVEAVVSRPGAREGVVSLPSSLPAPVAGAIGAAADTVRTVATGVSGLASDVSRAAVDTAGALVGAIVHAVTDPITTAAALPGAISALPGTVRDLVRSGAQTVEDGFQVGLHPGRLVDAVTLLGTADNRPVNDVASVTKLLLSGTAQTVWSGTPGASKAIAWSAPMSLAAVKEVGRGEGATVNDVLLAAIAGGLRRYLKLHRDEVREIQWMVPVNLKPFAENLPAELGNYFALVMLPMPLGEASARERIGQMKAQMRRIKRSDEVVLTFGLQRFMSVSPDQVQFVLTNFFANKTVGVLTNVPGPRGLLRFAGSPVTQIVGFAPCSGDQPMTATIFSYHGTVTVGFASDAGLVPDPDVLVALVADEVAAMQSLLAVDAARDEAVGATDPPIAGEVVSRAGS